MKRIYNEYTVLMLAVALLFSSCRRPIEEVVGLRAVIPMGTLWEKAGIAPQNVTALFYSKMTANWFWNTGLKTAPTGYRPMPMCRRGLHGCRFQ